MPRRYVVVSSALPLMKYIGGGAAAAAWRENRGGENQRGVKAAASKWRGGVAVSMASDAAGKA